MKKSDLYEIAIKIFGFYTFYLFFLTFIQLFDFFLMYMPFNEGIMYPETLPLIASYVVKASLMAFLSFYVIFKTKKIVSWVCKDDDYKEQVKLYHSKKDLYELSIRFIGLFLLLWAIPDLIVAIGNLTFANGTEPTFLEVDFTLLKTSLLRIVIGALAVLFANSVAKFFTKKESENPNIEEA